jgi:hypothetical protein
MQDIARSIERTMAEVRLIVTELVEHHARS